MTSQIDMTRVTFPALLLLLFMVFDKPVNAWAQTCDIVPATITTMNEPELGAYNLWDYVGGEYPAKEHFQGALYKDKNLYVAAQAQGNPDIEQMRLWLLQQDYRGRALWEKYHEIEGLSQIKAIVDHSQGFAVLATVLEDQGDQPPRAAMWFGVFQQSDGALLHEATIDYDQGSLFADAIVPLDGGKSYIVAGHTQGRDQKTYTLMYRIDDQGNVDVHRSYRSGEDNRVNQIVVSSVEGALVALGQTKDPAGRSVGWAIGLDHDLKLMWEQPYPRGNGAAFVDGASLGDSGIVAVGWAESLWQGQRAGLVMHFNVRDGALIWERYYRGQDNGRMYQARAVEISPGNVISVVLNGAPHPMLEKVDQDDPMRMTHYAYTRLLTMNKRGSVLLSEDYRNAQGASVNDILTGHSQNRIMFGSTLSADPILLDEAKKAGKRVSEDSFVSQNGWSIAVPAAGVDEDPCDEYLKQQEKGFE